MESGVAEAGERVLVCVPGSGLFVCGEWSSGLCDCGREVTMAARRSARRIYLPAARIESPRTERLTSGVREVRLYSQVKTSSGP